ncbi:MAG: NAD(P)/FAD-dependent oxidoreductase [Candidatus Heimdallarchaeota archaeon]
MQKTDVLVVGAGPAGSSAAKKVAGAGFTVQVFEEHPIVGFPLACGEGMSQPMLNRFPWAPKEGQPIEIQYLNFAGGYYGYIRINALSINRPVFDRKLIDIAQDEGAYLHTNTPVKYLARTSYGIEATTSQGIKTLAKIVIAADGPSSRMMRQMKLAPPNEIIQGVEYRVKGVEVEGFQFYFDFSITPHGYGWVFNKGERIANVGICLSGGKNPRERLDKFRKMRNLNGKIDQLIAGIIPSGGPVQQCFTDNFMVAGDAGGFTNPIFFGGIGTAMLTGSLAGETAVEALEEEDYSAWKLAHYEQKIQELPIVSQDLLQSHELLYHYFNNSDLARLGVLINTREFRFSSSDKLILLGRCFRHPSTWSRLAAFYQLMKGFRISRDWGF